MLFPDQCRRLTQCLPRPDVVDYRLGSVIVPRRAKLDDAVAYDINGVGRFARTKKQTACRVALQLPVLVDALQQLQREFPEEWSGAQEFDCLIGIFYEVNLKRYAVE